MKSSFRGNAKHRTRNLEIPGLRQAAHPGMTKTDLNIQRLVVPKNAVLVKRDAPVA